MRCYVFVDAENHFIRSNAAAEDIIGSSRAAEALSKAKLLIPGISGFPNHIEGDRFGWNRELQLFWDCELLSRTGIVTLYGAHISRAVWVGSCSGDEDKAHSMRVQLRKYDFEPIVVRELKDKRGQREVTLKQQGLIEKAKGCDIEVVTRMVSDAAANLYDCCFLFTSDADFLPAIEAVRRMGKIVWVFGYQSALPNRSSFLHVPDRFIDLGELLANTWVNNETKITNALKALGETGPFKSRLT